MPRTNIVIGFLSIVPARKCLFSVVIGKSKNLNKIRL